MGAGSQQWTWPAAVRILAAADLRDGAALFRVRDEDRGFAPVWVGDPARPRRDCGLSARKKNVVYADLFDRRGGGLAIRALPGAGFICARGFRRGRRGSGSAARAARPD